MEILQFLGTSRRNNPEVADRALGEVAVTMLLLKYI